MQFLEFVSFSGGYNLYIGGERKHFLGDGFLGYCLLYSLIMLYTVDKDVQCNLESLINVLSGKSQQGEITE